MIVFLAGVALFATGCQEQSREKALAEGSQLVAAGNAKGAMVIYTALLERDPKDTQARYELAQVYLKLGKPKQAAKEAQLLADGPNPPVRLPVLIGQIHIAQNEAEEALKGLAAYLSEHPDVPDAWETKGQAHARIGDLSEAAAAFQHALSLNPQQKGARIGLALVRFRQGQLPEAQAELYTLLADDLNNYEGLRLLGQVQAKNNDFAGAVAAYERIVASHPKDIEARYYAAFYRLAAGNQLEEVAAAARKLMTEYPERAEGYQLQGLLELFRGESAKAVNHLQQALRLRADVQNHYYLAQAYDRAGRVEVAISELELVLEYNPQHVKARQLLASLHLRMNRPDAAIAELEKILRAKPDDDETKRMLGDIYLVKGQFDTSLGYYEAIPEGSPQSVRALMQQSRIMAALEKPGQAEALLRRALAQAPDNLEVRLTLAAMLTQRRLPDAAVAVLDQAGLSPKDAAQVQLVKAGILAGQGKDQEALDLLEMAKTSDPTLMAPYFAEASIAFHRNDAATAMAQLRLLLKRFPGDPVAQIALAASLEDEGRFEEARTQLEQAAGTGRCEGVLELAAFLVHRNDPQTALKVLGERREACAGFLPALVFTARLQAALGAEADSLASIRKIEAADPGAGLAERLRLAMTLKRWQNAAQDAARLFEQQDVSTEDLARAASLVEKGDLSGAQGVVRLHFPAGSSDGDGRLGLAALLLHMGRPQEAARYFDAPAANAPAQAAAAQAGGEGRQSVAPGLDRVWNRESVWQRDKSISEVLAMLSMIQADDPASAGVALGYAMGANVLEGDKPQLLDALGYAMLKNDRQQDAIFILQKAALLDPKNQDIVSHLYMASVNK